MKAVPQIINNECGDGDCGAEGGRGAGGHGLVQFGGAGRRGIREAQGGFFMCVSLECVLWGRGAEWESGSSGKDPSGPHLAAT